MSDVGRVGYVKGIFGSGIFVKYGLIVGCKFCGFDSVECLKSE